MTKVPLVCRYVSHDDNGNCTVEFFVDAGRITKPVRARVSRVLGEMRGKGLIKFHQLDGHRLIVKVRGPDLPEEVLQTCYSAFGDCFVLEHYPKRGTRAVPVRPTSSYVITLRDGRYWTEMKPDRDDRAPGELFAEQQ